MRASLALGLIVLVGNAALGGLVSHWSFDEGAGSTVSDSVGSNHGTLTVTGASFVPGGVQGGALSLTRSLGGYAIFPSLSLVNTDFSITAWMQTIDTDNNTFLLSKHNSGVPGGFFLLVNDSGPYGAPNHIAFYTGGAPAAVPVSTTQVNDGRWHFVAAVHHEGGVNEIYVDGIPFENAVVSAPLISASASFLIGALTVGPPLPSYTGLVDEVRLFNHALTPAEVAGLFNSVVPEPGSGLLLAALCALGTLRRRTFHTES